MKKLYLVTAQTVVWAHSKEHVMAALSTINNNDMWLIEPADVQEINHEDDVPPNWGLALSPVDSDRALSDDSWAGKSTLAILNMIAESKKPTAYTVEDRILEMQMSIAKLEVAADKLTQEVNNLTRAKLYA